MKYRFEFRPYRRTFKQPLATSHGLWEVREGIILRLIDRTGRAGFGEIAPLKWFGSESSEQALEFCGQLPSEISTDDIFAVPSELPACQFGFESAWEDVTSYLQLVNFGQLNQFHSVVYCHQEKQHLRVGEHFGARVIVPLSGKLA
jgi:O-succinylbenzoate synthase